MSQPTTRRSFLKNAALLSATAAALPSSAVSAGASTFAKDGPFAPTWESLAAYQTPEWFRDAKFGIWAHWGPQCQPEQGDWYARKMYMENDRDHAFQTAHYGHPSKAGFKEVIHEWKAENWQPDYLMDLYQKAGAKYFMALANHHDNFDNYNSKYQPAWNSTKMGPKKDLVGGWEKAARKRGMKFAVSSHSSRAWSWYEVAQGADTMGPYAGVPYDGKMTKADGVGLWWDGLDPQELYAQSHVPGEKLEWSWDAAKGSSVPDAAYCEKFYKRTIDLLDKYHPDLIYFDDTVLPLYPISDVGLRIAATMYNQSVKRSGGGPTQAVLTGKGLNPDQRKCLVWDIERGVSNMIEPLPWQTDTCIGDWHYSRPLFDRHGYKSARQVAQTLVDIISKNGNLMLNIPLPGNGMPDSDELKFLADFSAWMQITGGAIYGTRPWKVCGEGPSMEAAAAVKAGNFNEGKNKPYTAQDLRFVKNGDDMLNVFALGWPEGEQAGTLTITSLANNSPLISQSARVERVELLGHNGTPLATTRDEKGLHITLPAQKSGDYVYAFQIKGRGIAAL